MRAVNLLTPELRSSQKGSGAPRPSAVETPGGIGALVVLGALALVVAAIAGVVLSNNVIKDREATLAQVNAKNEATVKRAAELKPYAEFQTLAQERAATVQALASARFDWEQSFRDLSRALPSNVSVAQLKGSVGGGSGASGLRASIGSPAIELTGCTRSQPAVATLMSRLRNVQGVTRVTLAKSEKTAVAGAAGGPGGLCGKGSPNFEVIVFFEKATVGSALATATGESAAPAAGAAAPAADANGKPADDSAAKPASTPAAQGGTTP